MLVLILILRFWHELCLLWGGIAQLIGAVGESMAHTTAAVAWRAVWSQRQ